MNFRRTLSALLCLCLALSLVLCSGCGTSGKESDAVKMMLEKYYISSPEKLDAEFEVLFEQRLLNVAQTVSIPVDTSNKEAVKNSVAEECVAAADAAGVSAARYASDMGFRSPAYAEGSFADPLNPDFYYIYAQGLVQIDAAVDYLARLWEIDGEDGESQKATVMEYCMENAKISYHRPNSKLHLLKGKTVEKLTAKTGPGIEIFVVGEDGYAAVYTKASAILNHDELRKLQGEQIYGKTGIIGVSHISDAEDWEYLIANIGGHLALVEFNRFITAEKSNDYHTFVSIYGVEPKLYN